MPRKRRRPVPASAPVTPRPRNPLFLLDLIALSGHSVPMKPHVSITTDAWLRYFESRYTETKNPVFAWEAIAWALVDDVPFPMWVTDYLWRAATRMRALSRIDIPTGEIPPPIARALEFPRQRRVNPFRALSATVHDARSRTRCTGKLCGRMPSPLRGRRPGGRRPCWFRRTARPFRRPFRPPGPHEPTQFRSPRPPQTLH